MLGATNMLGRPMIAAPPRIACIEPCFIAGEPKLRATTWNVSVRGVFLVVDPVPEPGTHLRISFSLPNESEPIGAEVKVVWLNPPSPVKGNGSRVLKVPPGCGLEFVDIDEQDMERIQAHVASTTTLRHQAGSAA